MSIVIGVLLIAAGALVFTGALVATRSERPSHWINDTVAANVLGPAIILMLALGAGLLIRGLAQLNTLAFGALEAALVVAVLAASYGAWRLLRVRETLVAYGTRTAASEEAIIATRDSASTTPVVSIDPPPRSSGPGRRAA